MQVEVVTRGNIVKWTATPKDVDGNVTTPVSVTLYLADVNGVAIGSPLPMVNIAGAWSVEWDSSAMATTPLFWSIRAVSPSAAADGRIEITANPANPAP